MNPRLVEPGFVVVCLHANVPARPGQDENGEDDAQASQRHRRENDTRLTCAAQARPRLLAARRFSFLPKLECALHGS